MVLQTIQAPALQALQWSESCTSDTGKLLLVRYVISAYDKAVACQLWQKGLAV